MSGTKTRKKPAVAVRKPAVPKRAAPKPVAPPKPVARAAAPKPTPPKPKPPSALLRISSRNYSSWSMRGWLILRLSGLPFRTQVVSPDDPTTRAELMMNSSSILLPCLEHDGAEIWDTLGIAEYLNELLPEAGLFPTDRVARARCRSISGEMHAGFHALRTSLPVNLRAQVKGFTVWSAARADIERIQFLWRDCLERWGGPWLFGAQRTVADAMFAPVVTRFRTYDVKLAPACEAYARTVEGWADFQEWVAAAKQEPEARITELEFGEEV